MSHNYQLVDNDNVMHPIDFLLANEAVSGDMVEFHNSYYNDGRTKDNWKWEYSTYMPSKSVFVYAKDGNKIIATQGMLPFYLTAGENVILSGKSENTLMLPSYRGTGIMKKVYDYATIVCIENGIECLWGFTDAIEAFHKFGFNSYPVIQTLMKHGNPWIDISYRLKIKMPLYKRLGSIIKLLGLSCRYNKTLNKPLMQKETELEVVKGTDFNLNLLEDLHCRIKYLHQNMIGIKYDQKYFRWRVREHPFINYEGYQIFSKGQLRGYAIVALYNGIASISDILSEDVCTTDLLLSEIMKDYSLKAGRFQYLGNSANSIDQSIILQLKRWGFVIYSKTNFVIKSLRNDKDIFHNIEKWHVNGLWTEGFNM
jgi:GNAT superfamily N-acetyltransferase